MPVYPPESLAALTGWIVSSERSSGSGARCRRYHIVVLSDHASPRAKRQDRFGADLGEVCTQLMQEEVASLDAPVEEWGRVESAAEDLAGSGVTGRAANRAAAASRRHIDQSAEATTAEISVLGSGNLGTLYVHSRVRTLSGGSAGTLAQARSRPLRPQRHRIHRRPGLRRCAVGLGAHGRVRLDTGEVTGQDPLQPYGDHAARVLRRAVMMPEAPTSTSTAASKARHLTSRHSNRSSVPTVDLAAGRTVQSC